MLRVFLAGGIHVGWASVKLILKAWLIFLCGMSRELEPLPDECRNCERSFVLFLEQTAIIAELLPFFWWLNGRDSIELTQLRRKISKNKHVLVRNWLVDK